MKIKNKKLKKVYDYLQDKRNKIKFRSFIFMGFLLGLNTFAWFIYITTVSGDVTANVVGWDITFTNDENEVIETVKVQIDDMFPGMETFTKSFDIQNRSDLAAKFEYDIISITLFGDTYTQVGGDFTNESITEILNSKFPFRIYFSQTGEAIATGEKLSFSLNVDWPFIATEDYFQINNFYHFADGMIYYTKEGTNYVQANPTLENFATLVESGLYGVNDEVDTYWGEMSSLYKSTNPEASSLELTINLKVRQNTI